MTKSSLEAVLAERGNPVQMLRNSQIGAYVYPVVPNEFSNWRDEQRAWRETAVLFDQSHHMAELMVEGPDAAQAAVASRRSTASRNFRSTGPSTSCRAAMAGHVIGDVIIFHLRRTSFCIGRPRADGRTGSSSTARPAATT